MKILSIEPTPSPNSMKIVIDQDLPFGKSFNYTKDNIEQAPENTPLKYVKSALWISGSLIIF